MHRTLVALGSLAEIWRVETDALWVWLVPRGTPRPAPSGWPTVDEVRCVRAKLLVRGAVAPIPYTALQATIVPSRSADRPPSFLLSFGPAGAIAGARHAMVVRCGRRALLERVSALDIAWADGTTERYAPDVRSPTLLLVRSSPILRTT